MAFLQCFTNAYAHAHIGNAEKELETATNHEQNAEIYSAILNWS